MQATQLINRLLELVEAHGDLELCYSTDDEGNTFKLTQYKAVEGTFEDYDFAEQTDKPTHICIN